MNPTAHWKFALAIVAGLLMTTAAQAQAKAPTPTQGGSINVAQEADWATLDPIGMGATTGLQAGKSIYDNLLDINEKGEIIPALAQSFTAARDAKSYRIKLRPGIKFHDGTPLDAEAVAFNVRRAADPANRCRCLPDLVDLAEVRVLGQIVMKQPASHFLAVLAEVPGLMASPAAIQKFGKDYGANPVGTGPFVLKEWKRGNFLHVVRNPNYWRAGLPYLDEVFYRPMPDEQTRIAALKAGNVDVVLLPAAKDVVESRKDRNLKVIDPGNLGSTFVMFMHKAEPMSDPRVRTAITLATDSKAIAKTILHGVYKPARTAFGSGLAAHEKVTSWPEFDLKKAQDLVKEIGKPIKFKFSIQPTPTSLHVAQALQQMWKRAGIEAEIHSLEQVQLIRNAIDSNFEAMLFRWPGRSDHDNNVYQFFHSKSTRNYVKYANPEMDRLLEAGRTLTDPAMRERIYVEINNLVARDLPYSFLWYSTPYIVTSAKVNGVPVVADGLLRTETVWKAK